MQITGGHMSLTINGFEARDFVSQMQMMAQPGFCFGKRGTAPRGCVGPLGRREWVRQRGFHCRRRKKSCGLSMEESRPYVLKRQCRLAGSNCNLRGSI
jgi:hypothetical protein